MIEYDLIYKCRRCGEIHSDKINFENISALEYFLLSDNKRLHKCFDEKGIGIADLIGSGEIVKDK